VSAAQLHSFFEILVEQKLLNMLLQLQKLMLRFFLKNYYSFIYLGILKYFA